MVMTYVNDANDILKIQNGFKIEKTENERNVVVSGSRLSLGKSFTATNAELEVHKTLNTRDDCFYGITHQKLRSLDHMEKLLYHLLSGRTHTRSETEFRVKDALKIAKKSTITFSILRLSSH